MKAIFNGVTIAESDKTVVVENKHYFPPESVTMEHLEKSGRQYKCPWKGLADYYNVIAEGKSAQDGAWMYPEPSDAAKQIKGHFAFWKEVEVVE